MTDKILEGILIYINVAPHCGFTEHFDISSFSLFINNLSKANPGVQAASGFVCRGDDGAVREDSAAVTENSIARKSTAAIGNVFSFVVATAQVFLNNKKLSF